MATGRAGAVKRALLFGACGAGAAAALVVVFLPALSLELMGDDYQWVQHARRATHHPVLLLADLGGFYRPLGTWTLVVDRLLWPFSPSGYHGSNLLLHLLAASLLGVAGYRLGLSPLLAGAVGGVWGLSPWAADPAVHVAARFDTLLVLCWAAMIAAWPRPEENWSPVRRLVAAVAVLGAALSKETWVVTPGLVLILDLVQRRRRGLPALLSAALVSAAALVYAAAHVAFLSLGRTYFLWDWGVLAKFPHQLASFLLLVPGEPAGFRWTAASAFAVLVLGGLGWGAWRTRAPAVAVGLGLLVLPTLPTLATPVLPLRYAAASHAGFLLAVAGFVGVGLVRLSPRWRRVSVVGSAVAALALGGWGAVRVRLELEDARRVSDLHTHLLEQAARVAPQLPVEVPVLLISQAEASPLVAVVGSPVGWRKPHFVRGDDPAGLVDSAALFAWLVQAEGLDVRHMEDWGGAGARRPGPVLTYAWNEGFRWHPQWVADAGAAARALHRERVAVRLFEVTRLAPAGGP